MSTGLTEHRSRRLHRPLLAASLLLLPALPALAGVGLWTPVGPPGGSVSALAVSDKIAGIAYVGTQDAGVFRSFDDGFDWVSASSRLVGDTGAFPSITALEIDPRRRSPSRRWPFTPKAARRFSPRSAATGSCAARRPAIGSTRKRPPVA